MTSPNSPTEKRRPSVELVLRQLRAHHFAVLSTVDRDGNSHSAGVSYGESGPGGELAIYVMTRTHLQQAQFSLPTDEGNGGAHLRG